MRSLYLKIKKLILLSFLCTYQVNQAEVIFDKIENCPHQIDTKVSNEFEYAKELQNLMLQKNIKILKKNVDNILSKFEDINQHNINLN